MVSLGQGIVDRVTEEVTKKVTEAVTEERQGVSMKLPLGRAHQGTACPSGRRKDNSPVRPKSGAHATGSSMKRVKVSRFVSPVCAVQQKRSQTMRCQLGINAMKPGVSGREKTK